MYQTIYNYHPQTGEFMDSGLADASPLEPGKFLVPAHATTTPPPEPGQNETVLFTNDHWVIQPDYRGKVFYSIKDGTPSTVSQIGPLPTQLTHKPRPSPLHHWHVDDWKADTKALQALRWQAIQAKRNHLTNTGGYKVADKWFHSDPKSRNQQLNLALLGDNLPKNLQWKTMDGSFVTITSGLVQQILAAAALHDQAIFAAAEAHKTAMEASANPADHDFSTGWPEVFSA